MTNLFSNFRTDKGKSEFKAQVLHAEAGNRDQSGEYAILLVGCSRCDAQGENRQIFVRGSDPTFASYRWCVSHRDYLKSTAMDYFQLGLRLRTANAVNCKAVLTLEFFHG